MDIEHRFHKLSNIKGCFSSQRCHKIKSDPVRPHLQFWNYYISRDGLRFAIIFNGCGSVRSLTFLTLCTFKQIQRTFLWTFFTWCSEAVLESKIRTFKFSCHVVKNINITLCFISLIITNYYHAWFKPCLLSRLGSFFYNIDWGRGGGGMFSSLMLPFELKKRECDIHVLVQMFKTRLIKIN